MKIYFLLILLCSFQDLYAAFPITNKYSIDKQSYQDSTLRDTRSVHPVHPHHQRFLNLSIYSGLTGDFIFLGLVLSGAFDFTGLLLKAGLLCILGALIFGVISIIRHEPHRYKSFIPIVAFLLLMIIAGITG